MTRRCGTLLLALAAGCRSMAPPAAAPARAETLEVTGPGGEQYFIVIAGTEVPLRTSLRDAAGREIALAARPAFVSRAPDLVAVDTAGVVRGIAMGEAYVVAKVTHGGRVLEDSVRVRVECTMELRVGTFPADTTIRVGESFVPRVELASCGGYLRLHDVFTWRARDPRVIRVDAATGRTTGLAPGEGWVDFAGERYGPMEGIRVRVVPR